MRKALGTCGLLVIPLLTLSSCAMFPSEPLWNPLALHKVGHEYLIRLSGHCTYADATVVKIRVNDGTDTVWEAWLPAGSTENEILVGDSGHGVSTHIPLKAQSLTTPTGRIDVSVSDSHSDTPQWSGDFMLNRVGETLNGGSAYDDEPIDVATLNTEVEC